MTTENTVIELIAREAKRPPEEIGADTSLEEIGIDSLKAIVILAELEDTFGIEVPNEMVASIKKVGDIVGKIDELRQKKGAA